MERPSGFKETRIIHLPGPGDTPSEESRDFAEIVLSSRPTQCSGIRGAGDIAYTLGANAGSSIWGIASYGASFLYGKEAVAKLAPESHANQMTYVNAGKEMIQLINNDFKENIKSAEFRELLTPEIKDIPQSEFETTIADVNDYVMNTTEAFIDLRKEQLDPLDETEIEEIQNFLIKRYNDLKASPQTADKQFLVIKDEYKKLLLKKLGKNYKKKFKKQVHLVRGKNTPRVLKTRFNIAGQQVEEEAELINTKHGGEYLELVGLEEDARNVFENSRNRTSESKSYSKVAGKTVNGWAQSLDVDGENLATVFRSGVFSVHSLKTNSIEKLHRLKQMKDQKAAQKLLELPKGMTIDEAIERRTHIGIAQALPKILASIEKSSQDPKALKNALTTGSFLHVEMSLLTEIGKEKRMIKDMVDVMSFINEHLKVRFSKEPQPMEVHENGDIIVTLPITDSMTEEHLGETFKTSAIFFNQGVNGQQSKVNMYKDSDVQYSLNDQSLNQILEYAIETGKIDEFSSELKSFLDHYGEHGFREAKDLAGLDIIMDLVHAMSGQIGIVCKSGKDRTGMEMSRIFSNQLIKNKPEVYEKMAEEVEAKTKKVPTEFEVKKAIKNEFDRSLSYVITGYNTGIEKGFAFSGLAYSSMPSELSPAWSLCRAGAAT
ncbi:MAG: hypothetical protein K940chlam3_00322 [Chlamydiae bacterium]|nr:hypothetical protein [Chlamydiota bacterium]